MWVMTVDKRKVRKQKVRKHESVKSANEEA